MIIISCSRVTSSVWFIWCMLVNVGSFGIIILCTGDMLGSNIASLSGDQKSRLAYAILTMPSTVLNLIKCMKKN